MTQDTIIDFPETPVAYAAGDRERPIHEQAPVAFQTLEASLPVAPQALLRSADYHAQIPAIGTTSAEMRCRQDFDPSRPCGEVYRSQRDMYVMVPVR